MPDTTTALLVVGLLVSTVGVFFQALTVMAVLRVDDDVRTVDEDLRGEVEQ